MEQIRSIEEIKAVKTEMEEILSYIRDPCMRAHFDSFLSALRWMLKEKPMIFPGWSDKK
jgi:hypothetical protein